MAGGFIQISSTLWAKAGAIGAAERFHGRGQQNVLTDDFSEIQNMAFIYDGRGRIIG